MSHGPAGGYFPKDLFLDVSRGVGPTGWIGQHRFGRNSDVDAAEDIWSYGGDWVAPTAARIHAIVSDSGNDTSAGTGARTVQVSGLNGSYAITTETVTMNGATPVNTANSYVIIHHMLVLTAGSGGTNAGNITATAATDSTVSAYMVAGYAHTHLGIYQIPAGYTGYLFQWETSAQNTNANSIADLAFFIKPFGGIFYIESEVGLCVSGGSEHTHDWIFPIVVTEKTTLKTRCMAVSVANFDVQASFDLLLIPN